MVGFRLYVVLLFIALIAAGCQQRDELSSMAVADSGRDASVALAGGNSGAEPSQVWAATASDEAGGLQYFIEFRARLGYGYGHSLVVYGLADRNGELVEFDVAGLTPAGPSFVPGHVVPVPAETGVAQGDLDETAVTARWRVPLSKSEYESVAASIRQLQATSPVWHAALYNCNAFVADIAHSMGYQTPMTWLPPHQFVNVMREMNSGRAGAAAMAYAQQSTSQAR